jgi:hypothetical protein
MSVKLICDVCKKNPALGKVSVAFNAENVVEPDTTTGMELALDACEACRPRAFQQLAADVLARLERHVPLHRAMFAARRDEDAAARELESANKEIAGLKLAGQPIPTKLAASALELEQKVATARSRYNTAFEAGKE